MQQVFSKYPCPAAPPNSKQRQLLSRLFFQIAASSPAAVHAELFTTRVGAGAQTKACVDGYHAWASRQPFARVEADAQLQPLILTAHREGRKEYGSPRVVRWLAPARPPVQPPRRVGRLMRQMGLAHRPGRRFKPMSLTDSNHDLPVAPNLLPHRLPTLKPDTVWVATPAGNKAGPSPTKGTGDVLARIAPAAGFLAPDLERFP